MKREEIKALFPIKAKVTNNIIKTAYVEDIEECIGAKALRKVLPKEIRETAIWGTTYGLLNLLDGGEAINITTAEGIDMMKIKEPRKITFILN